MATTLRTCSPMPLDMAWEEIVDSELGIIIRAEDCLHCVELRAILSEQPLSAPMDGLTNKMPMTCILSFRFSASVDILPCRNFFRWRTQTSGTCGDS